MRCRELIAPPVTAKGRRGQHDGRLRTNATWTQFGEFALEKCSHPSLSRVPGRYNEYQICDLCREVLGVIQADDHPEISRWLNEGGAIGRERP